MKTPCPQCHGLGCLNCGATGMVETPKGDPHPFYLVGDLPFSARPAIGPDGEIHYAQWDHQQKTKLPDGWKWAGPEPSEESCGCRICNPPPQPTNAQLKQWAAACTPPPESLDEEITKEEWFGEGGVGVEPPLAPAIGPDWEVLQAQWDKQNELPDGWKWDGYASIPDVVLPSGTVEEWKLRYLQELALKGRLNLDNEQNQILDACISFVCQNAPRSRDALKDEKKVFVKDVCCECVRPIVGSWADLPPERICVHGRNWSAHRKCTICNGTGNQPNLTYLDRRPIGQNYPD